ncbi:MAG: hypothetical protein ACK50J_03280, partial [Planctomyces sp.]
VRVSWASSESARRFEIQPGALSLLETGLPVIPTQAGMTEIPNPLISNRKIQIQSSGQLLFEQLISKRPIFGL